MQNIAVVYNRLLSNSISNELLAGVNYFNQVFNDYNTNYDVQSPRALSTGAPYPNAPNMTIGNTNATGGGTINSGGSFDPVGLTPPEGRSDITRPHLPTNSRGSRVSTSSASVASIVAPISTSSTSVTRSDRSALMERESQAPSTQVFQAAPPVRQTLPPRNDLLQPGLLRCTSRRLPGRSVLLSLYRHR